MTIFGVAAGSVVTYLVMRRSAVMPGLGCRRGRSGRRYRVGRRTVVKAMASAGPSLGKNRCRAGPSYRRLTDVQHTQDVSYPVVRTYVAERKPQIRAEAGRGQAEVFIAQSHRPGAEAEVDFGEIVVRLSGELVSCSLFCLRLSFSGKAVHRVSLSGGKERTKEPRGTPATRHVSRVACHTRNLKSRSTTRLAPPPAGGQTA